MSTPSLSANQLLQLVKAYAQRTEQIMAGPFSLNLQHADDDDFPDEELYAEGAAVAGQLRKLLTSLDRRRMELAAARADGSLSTIDLVRDAFVELKRASRLLNIVPNLVELIKLAETNISELSAKEKDHQM